MDRTPAPPVDEITVNHDGGDWITANDAAEILGITSTRVTQLIRRGRLPAERQGRRRGRLPAERQGRRRWRLRRHQVEVIANARDARKLRGTLGRD